MEIIGSQLIAKTGVLTPREAETALWIAEGKTREEAAMILGCSRRTVGNHLEHAMDKVGAHNLPAFVSRLWMMGVLKPSRSIGAVFLMGLVLLGTLNTHIDQARLRPARSGGRTTSARAGRREDLDLDSLGLLWS